MEITYIHLLKVVLCSAVLYGYYLAVLKDRQFHHFNRFYLLSAVAISWIIPFINFELPSFQGNSVPVSYHIAEIIAEGNSSFETLAQNEPVAMDWMQMFNVLLTLVSFIIAAGIIRSLFKIVLLVKTCQVKRIGNLKLVFTDTKGTPFSFFSYVFWNRAVDLESSISKQMLAHEWVHSSEKHSVDKLSMELMMIAGWFNPFFWMMKKELYLIHEFIADSKSIGKNNSSALAALLLAAAYPQKQNLVVHPFFFSPIKRRINMIKNLNPTRFSHFRRIIALPVAAFLILLFSFRNSSQHADSLGIENQYVVVLDAAHGGSDRGAVSASGESESELALQLVNRIKAKNSNSRIRFELTRDDDRFVQLADRVVFSADRKASLYVSIHFNSSTNPTRRGLEIYCPKQGTTGFMQSLPFASIVEQSLQGLYSSTEVKTRKKSIWVLDKATVPAILIESGYISNQQDIELFKSKQNEIAEGIIRGIGQYLVQKEKGLISLP